MHSSLIKEKISPICMLEGYSLEIEIRLGKKEKYFTPGINKEAFFHIINMLEMSDPVETMDIKDKDSRYTYSKDGQIISVCRKINIKKEDIFGKEILDVRVSVNLEQEQELDIEETNFKKRYGHIRNKKRYTKKIGNCTLDLTIVNDKSYEVEVEINNIEYIDEMVCLAKEIINIIDKTEDY